MDLRLRFVLDDLVGVTLVKRRAGRVAQWGRFALLMLE